MLVSSRSIVNIVECVGDPGSIIFFGDEVNLVIAKIACGLARRRLILAHLAPCYFSLEIISSLKSIRCQES